MKIGRVSPRQARERMGRTELKAYTESELRQALVALMTCQTTNHQLRAADDERIRLLTEELRRFSEILH